MFALVAILLSNNVAEIPEGMNPHTFESLEVCIERRDFMAEYTKNVGAKGYSYFCLPVGESTDLEGLL